MGLKDHLDKILIFNSLKDTNKLFFNLDEVSIIEIELASLRERGFNSFILFGSEDLRFIEA